MDVRVGLWRKLSTEELMLLNCGVGEDSWESLGLQGNQSWVFFGRNDAKAETPILWPPMWRVDSLEETNAGRDWGQEEKGTTEDEMAGWHHRLDGRAFEWTPGVLGDGRGAWRAAIYGVAKSQTWLSDWTELNIHIYCYLLKFTELRRYACLLLRGFKKR